MRKAKPLAATAAAILLATFGLANADDASKNETIIEDYDEPAVQAPMDQDLKDPLHGVDAPGPAQMNEDAESNAGNAGISIENHPAVGDPALHEQNLREALHPGRAPRTISRPSPSEDASSDAANDVMKKTAPADVMEPQPGDFDAESNAGTGAHADHTAP